jgi:hypothetical protein
VFEACLHRDVKVRIDDIPGIGEYVVPGLKSFARIRGQAVRRQLASRRD